MTVNINLNRSVNLNFNKLKLNKSTADRFIELDLLRGFAIMIMVSLHALWDLDYFGLVPLNQQIYQFGKIAPIMFFLLVGMCLAVSYNRKANKPSYDQKKYNQHCILRGLKIFSLGMILTTATLLFMPDRPILFGVLHCIGFCIILSAIFLKMKPTYTFLIGAMVILVGFVMPMFPVENPTMLHLAAGLHQTNIYSYTVDYFPIFPWLGLCLVGIALGRWLYKDNKRQFRMPDLSKYKPISAFSWLGQHSLAIYLLHQPIIAGALFLFIIL
ncbi:MAG: heparan-alpha-glucosaminide N-acetyltransferase [Euryarchaeota archaeon]|nr:heparan-alpha-glucosaminide N-acetyltransferase [Euryarchaeota archaeon]